MLRVVVVGAGGIGNQLLTMLGGVLNGVGATHENRVSRNECSIRSMDPDNRPQIELHIVDGDIVEDGNVGRQLHGTNSIKQFKCDAVATRLRASSNFKVESHPYFVNEDTVHRFMKLIEGKSHNNYAVMSKSPSEQVVGPPRFAYHTETTVVFVCPDNILCRGLVSSCLLKLRYNMRVKETGRPTFSRDTGRIYGVYLGNDESDADGILSCDNEHEYCVIYKKDIEEAKQNGELERGRCTLDQTSIIQSYEANLSAAILGVGYFLEYILPKTKSNFITSFGIRRLVSNFCLPREKEKVIIKDDGILADN